VDSSFDVKEMMSFVVHLSCRLRLDTVQCGRVFSSAP
jgi:hypothetical protein